MCRTLWTAVIACFFLTTGQAASAETLRIASFNIQFLGNSSERDNAALASIVDPFDIVVVQEVVSPPYPGDFPDGAPFKPDPDSTAFFDEMRDLGFAFVLSEEDSGPGDTIHRNGSTTEWFVAFYRPETVSLAPSLPSGFLADDRSNHDDYERVPYAFAFQDQSGTTDFVLISVHLNKGTGPSNRARRAEEIAAIVNWIDDNDATEKDFIILGDMNFQSCTELGNQTPQGYLSLNDECRATNTNVNNPRTYDHVMYNVAHTTSDIDLAFDLEVIDLITVMRPFWEDASTDPYPGDPYDHNKFRKFYSDHHPIGFRITIGSADDD